MNNCIIITASNQFLFICVLSFVIIFFLMKFTFRENVTNIILLHRFSFYVFFPFYFDLNVKLYHLTRLTRYNENLKPWHLTNWITHQNCDTFSSKRQLHKHLDSQQLNKLCETIVIVDKLKWKKREKNRRQCIIVRRTFDAFTGEFIAIEIYLCRI